MPWGDIRAGLAKIFGDVSIEEPSAQKIIKVYKTPPSKVMDWPCVVFYPPAADVVGREFSGREVHYTARCRVLVKDADIDVAADAVDSFREAILDAFDSATKIRDATDGARLIGQVCEEAAAFAYGGVNFTGFDCILTIGETQAKDFTT